MTNELTLHCFPGDTNSLALILLADHLKIDLKLRYLKPVNVAEKFYKTSLTRKFPMLEVKNGDTSYMVERSTCIARFLTSQAPSADMSKRTSFAYAQADQNTEVLAQYVSPALATLRAMRAGIFEEDKDLDGRLLSELHERLLSLDRVIATQAKTPLNYSDFFLFTVLRAAADVGCLNPTLKQMNACIARFRHITEAPAIAQLLAAFDPARHN